MLFRACAQRASVQVPQLAMQALLSTGRTVPAFEAPRALLHSPPLISAALLQPACRQAAVDRTQCRSLGTTSVTPVMTEIKEVVDSPPSHLLRMTNNFCRMCGSKLQLIRPPTESGSWRHMCSNAQCGYIDYQNPRMVVGCIVEHEGKILLCKRAIEPCKGLWTVPAGYMELAESSAEGAARETREEACAEVDIQAPFCHWDIPVIGQAYILFRGRLAAPFTHAPGPESLETALFSPEDIPFDSIAFSSVALSLRYYLEDRQSGGWRIHHGVVDKKPGSAPNDPATFGVVKLIQLPLAHHSP